MSPLEFVEVVTALREAERAVALEDSAAALFEVKKAEILEREEVTEAQLRAFLVDHRDDTTLLEQVWDTITERLKHVPARDRRFREEPAIEREPIRAPPPRPTASDTGEQRLH